MATRHSTRRQASSRAGNHSKGHANPIASTPQKAISALKKRTRPLAQAVRTKKNKASGPRELDEILARFAEALALLETGHAVLDTAQQDWEGEASQLGCPAVQTLKHSIAALERSYDEVETAFMTLS